MMQRREIVSGIVTAAGAAAAAGLAPRVARAQSLVAAVDRVGLLLPKSAGPFARASAAVRSGIEAGYRRDGRGLAVDIYEIEESPVALAAAYRGMLERGTALALGPLTRRRRDLHCLNSAMFPSPPLRSIRPRVKRPCRGTSSS
jgi:hypothetical protein